MDHSNETSQQNISRKRGQRKGFCYSNLPTLEPCDLVPQFILVRGKKSANCAGHKQCHGFGYENYISQNETRNFHQSSSNHAANLQPHFTQISAINASSVINISNQSVEGFVAQQ